MYSTINLKEAPKLLVAFAGLSGINSSLGSALHTVCNSLIEFVIFSHCAVKQR